MTSYQPKTITDLLAAITSCPHYKLLKVIAENPDIRTHQLRELKVFSNNYHQQSLELNQSLARYGWVIEKRPIDGVRCSWAWRLVVIKQEAANDAEY